MDVIKPFHWYEKEEIEDLAANIRLQVESKRTRRLNADSIAEAVADELDLGIIWQSLPVDHNEKIAAIIFPTKREIIINSNIPTLQERFGQSTIAHEIGHWLLHINHLALNQYFDRLNRGIETNIKPFLCRSNKYSHGIEWQAQYFAGCLLMPRYKLIEAKLGRDLTNWKHLYAIADEFGVTISNLTVRLRSLGWITIKDNSKQISRGKYLPK